MGYNTWMELEPGCIIEVHSSSLSSRGYTLVFILQFSITGVLFFLVSICRSIGRIEYIAERQRPRKRGARNPHTLETNGKRKISPIRGNVRLEWGFIHPLRNVLAGENPKKGGGGEEVLSPHWGFPDL